MYQTNMKFKPTPPLYDLDHWMIGWNDPDATSPCVRVGPWPDLEGWSKEYDSTSGCCFVEYWPKLTRQQKLQEIVNGFFYLVLGEGLDPQAVHAEFWKIAEYRELELPFLGHGPYIMFQGEGRCDPYNP